MDEERKNMAKIPTVLELLKAGVHFGHQSSRWHPKMQPYIFGVRNSVHIIDLEKTIAQLEKVQKFIDQIVSNGGTILFLGTKKQVQSTIKQEAQKCNMPYMVERWIGGFFTNFSVVIKLAQKYKNLVKKKESGDLEKYTKKERMEFEKEIDKMEKTIFGVKDMEKLPDAMFVWDVRSERTAIDEANLKNIPVIGICDSNTNPSKIDYVIPSNDDATKGIELIIGFIADCINDSSKSVPAGNSKK